jgi:hypothetical protein
MARNQKNSFYRTLQLPKEEAEILKWYRKNIGQILNNADKKAETKEKEK